ncbi:MAG: DUF4301 domain-containing protein [Marinilabiliales bacterium]|nr:MAG: DUF4301 domain-containing protein [Marinilabiliales bacterium]
MFQEKDISYLQSLGISQEEVYNQIDLLKKNNSFLKIHAAATPDKGIKQIQDKDKYLDLFDKNSKKYKIGKFVPASGAATRMFKRLISFAQNPNEQTLNDGNSFSVKESFDNIDRFAFFETLKTCKNYSKEPNKLADAILNSCLGYGGIPKGLIEFHKYDEGSRTAFEEHLHEAKTLSSKDIDIHLTVSPEFMEDFKNKLNEINNKKGFNLNVNFSIQEKSTDTIALNEDKTPVKNTDGNLLLRPGGHGALIQNLNKINSDIVFIKNIDNLTHGDYLEETTTYKKLLGGVLIEKIEKIKEIYLELSENPTESAIHNAIEYLQKEFNTDFTKSSDKIKSIIYFINRPIRVCGMVQNTGEPGGGPYWVNKEGEISLQIVEKAQIDLSKPDQEKHLKEATHFNPVDLVCYLKSPVGSKFDLNRFIDKDACFVSEKTHMGNNIRVLEHPGLWNGAM